MTGFQEGTINHLSNPSVRLLTSEEAGGVDGEPLSEAFEPHHGSDPVELDPASRPPVNPVNQAPQRAPRLLPVGDIGLSVEFGLEITPEANAAVTSLDRSIAAAEIDGIVETVPSFRSLLIVFEPAVVTRATLATQLRSLLADLGSRPAPPSRTWIVPVVYEPPFGEDIAEVAALLRKSEREVVAAHTGAEFRVYMLGFQPGLPNLGGLPEGLQISRRLTPRPPVPAGSVIIGGAQGAIMPLSSPTGFYMLGRTPVRVFDHRRREPALFRPGDRIRFRAIPPDEYAQPPRRSRGVRRSNRRRHARPRSLMADATLQAIGPAPFTTVQDQGRIGWRRYGVTGAGVMDLESHAIANALVGNPLEAATIEFAHGGGEWAARGRPIRVAVAGGSFAATINGRAIPPFTSATLRDGERLRIGGAKDAVWGYLAVSGGIGVPQTLGSRATYARGGLGGLEGRHLAAGDVLPVSGEAVGRGQYALRRPNADPDEPVRVVLGPQDDYFAREAIELFTSAPFEVTWQADRMGYRLAGPPLRHARGFNIVSDGILPGSIQVPGNGLPIVLLRDAQTTGGYPKIATVVTADLGRVAQKRPTSNVRFRAVSPDEAQLLRREFICRVQATGVHVRPA